VTPDGVLAIDKPAGVTSHDVVAAIRRRYGRGAKVGHAGTLDPFATGLLLVLLGRATRIQRFLMALPKSYEVVARLGWTSTTGDLEGAIAPGRMPPEPLALPTGTLRQRPPAFSAVKVGGRRAYALARAGVDVELEEREVTVSQFALSRREGERAEFAIACSSGTYVRALIADLGDAYCLALRRTRIGAFDVADADPEKVIGIDDALGFLPAIEVDADVGRRLGHGQPVRLDAPPDAVVRVRDPAGLVCLARLRPDGALGAIVGFRAP
jgi:tRNA pseudouridine55 synthase